MYRNPLSSNECHIRARGRRFVWYLRTISSLKAIASLRSIQYYTNFTRSRPRWEFSYNAKNSVEMHHRREVWENRCSKAWTQLNFKDSLHMQEGNQTGKHSPQQRGFFTSTAQTRGMQEICGIICERCGTQHRVNVCQFDRGSFSSIRLNGSLLGLWNVFRLTYYGNFTFNDFPQVFYLALDPASLTFMVLPENTLPFRISMTSSTLAW